MFDRIRDEIGKNDVLLFMKGTPVFPQCGFSAAVVEVLSELGVKFHGVNILVDPELRQGIKEFSQWPTIPQLYVKGEFVGGCDIIREMFETGELEQLMKEKGVTLANAPPDRSAPRRLWPRTLTPPRQIRRHRQVAQREAAMERASVRALACRAEGDMQRQEMLIGRMGLAGIAAPRCDSPPAPPRRPSPASPPASRRTPWPTARARHRRPRRAPGARRLWVALPEPITSTPSSRNGASLRPSAM